MLGANVETIMTVSCNDKLYKINLSSMKVDTYNLEGYPTEFCKDEIEFNTLLDRIYHIFYNGLKKNLSSDSRYLL